MPVPIQIRTTRARSPIAWAFAFCLAAFLPFPEPAQGGDTDAAEKHLRAGQELMESGDFKGGARELDLSVKEFPTEAALQSLGACYERLGRNTDAVAVYRQLLADFGDEMSADGKERVRARLSEITKILIQQKIEETDGGTAGPQNAREAALASTSAGRPIALPEGAEPPKPSKVNQQPPFPSSARRFGKAGSVVLRFAVGIDGAVSGVEVVEGEEPFVTSAVNAVKGWKYEPARYQGQPIAVYHTIKIAFRID